MSIVPLLTAAIALAWLAKTLALFRLHTAPGRDSVGLPLAFVLATTAPHWGSLVYLVPGYDHTRNVHLWALNFTPEIQLQGFATALLGLGAFVVGCFLRDLPRGHPAPRLPLAAPGSLASLQVATLLSLILGLRGFAATAILPEIQSLQPYLSVLRNQLNLFFCLLIIKDTIFNNGRHLRKIMAASPLITVCYFFFTGFVSYGLLALLALLALICGLRNVRTSLLLRSAPYSLLAVLAGLIVFSAYMQTRDAFRAIVWAGGGYNERLDALGASLAQLSAGGLVSSEALDAINLRLNHNIMIGKEIQYLSANPGLFLRGEELSLILLTWVPRALWPDKPISGGSEFVGNLTGLRFSDGTTIGPGPFFEGYAHFGYPGVVAGCMLLGIGLRSFDIACCRRLKARDYFSFSAMYLAGFALVNPAGTMFYMLSSALLAYLLATACSYVGRMLVAMVPAERPGIQVSDQDWLPKALPDQPRFPVGTKG